MSAKQLLTDITSYKVSKSDDDFTPPLSNLHKASILIMSVCLAMSPAPRPAGPEQSTSMLAVSSRLLQSRLVVAVFKLLHGNSPLNAGHAKLDLEIPLGECSLAWVKDTFTTIYRIDKSAMIPLPGQCII